MKGPRSSFTVRRSFRCQLCNVVYVVTCYKCDKLYIGETQSSFVTRLKEHLAGIRLGHTNLPVARHFCSPGHLMQEIRFSRESRVTLLTEDILRHGLSLDSTLSSYQGLPQLTLSVGELVELAVNLG